MTEKEKKLLKVMLLIVVLGFLFKGGPFVYQKYMDRQDDIANLVDKKVRLKALLKRRDFWYGEFNKSVKQQAIIEKELFTATSNELVAAKVQSVIKKLAKSSGVRVDSMRLAEFQQSEAWLLVNLSVTIKAGSAEVINFLGKIQANEKKLFIKDMSLRSYRNSMNGTITIVGFSKSIPVLPAKEGE
jgi:hypothetical protein